MSERETVPTAAPLRTLVVGAAAFVLGMAAGALTLVAWLTSANAGSLSDQADERIKIRDRNGRVTGTITPDTSVDGRLKIRDRDGRVTGTVEDGKARDRNGRVVPLTDLIDPRNKSKH